MRICRSYVVWAVCVGALAVGCDDDDPEDVITTRSSATADFTAYETFAIPTASDFEARVSGDAGTGDAGTDDAGVGDAGVGDAGGGGGRVTIPDDVAVNLEAVSDSMREQLTLLGLREVDAGQDPDLVAFSISSTREESALTWQCVDGYWYGYWAYSWDPCAWLAPVYTEYTAGTIVLGLADPELEEVVFGGLIQGIEDDDDEDIEERINDDVAEVFDAYPAEQTGE